MNSRDRQQHYRTGANEVVRAMIARARYAENQLERARQRGDDLTQYELALTELRDTLTAMLALRRVRSGE